VSKNFEMMQQMEQEQHPVTHLHTTQPPPARKQAGDAHNNISARARWARDEALRLVQQVFLLQTQEPPRVVVFAGIDHGNGCSHICASVAETLAQHATRPVCLVEANFRSPSSGDLFGTLNRHGLTEALLQPGPVSSFLEPVSQENLWLLPSGTLAVDSPSLLSSKVLGERIHELRQDFDFIVIDAPPLTRYSDAIVLSQHSDGLVLILEADSTRREAAATVAANLRSADVSVLAAVLNKRSYPIPSSIYQKL
jgi:receptor protein-tyrosine kinase